MPEKTQRMWGDKPYHSLDYEMKRRYGGKVYKLSLSSGCSCPNRDGTCGTGGCIFCSEGGSGDFAAGAYLPVSGQIEEAKQRIAAKRSKQFAGYIAYFQSFTNTYGPVGLLRERFLEAIESPEVLILSVATRPDCLPDEMISMLAKLNRIKPVWVELGLQTIHADTAARIRRGYALPVFEDALRRLKAAGLAVIVHVIIGLPGEDKGRTEETVRYLAAFKKAERPDGIKLHLLHVMRETALGEAYEKDAPALALPQYTPESYADTVIDLIEMLPPEMTVHRITGDAPKRLLLFPMWSADKKRVLNTIAQRFAARGAYQGRLFV